MGRTWIGLALAALLATAPGALAQDPAPDDPSFDEPPPPPPHVDVGIGENTPDLFGDPLFVHTGIRFVRLTVPYDVVRAGGAKLAQTDAWLQAARDQGLDPLVSFGFSQRRPHRRWRWHLPSVREYGARVREFRARYPWVHELTTWNEANHKRVQPTGTRPVRTAALYRELRRQCSDGSCRAVAVDILLTRSRRTWSWIRAFRRHAGPGRHIWGLHNYPDVNRHSSRYTRRFLRMVPGEVWFTETGGIVRFGRSWHRNEGRAARAVRFVFRLAALSPRIKRVYVYNWRASARNRRWDSGLTAPSGLPRPGYFSLVGALSEAEFSPVAPQPAPPPTEDPDDPLAPAP
jgi:hypothetical protein